MWVGEGEGTMLVAFLVTLKLDKVSKIKNCKSYITIKQMCTAVEELKIAILSQLNRDITNPKFSSVNQVMAGHGLYYVLNGLKVKFACPWVQ